MSFLINFNLYTYVAIINAQLSSYVEILLGFINFDNVKFKLPYMHFFNAFTYIIL
jgi:hypothetical protein